MNTSISLICFYFMLSFGVYSMAIFFEHNRKIRENQKEEVEFLTKYEKMLLAFVSPVIFVFFTIRDFVLDCRRVMERFYAKWLGD